MSYTVAAAVASLGTGNGQLSKPGAITRDKEGHLWVADTENNRVEEFNSSGEYMNKWGTVGGSAGQFKKPEGIAIDKEGHVWVADTGNNRIEAFTSAGTFIQTDETTEFAFPLKAPTALLFGQSCVAGPFYALETGNSRVKEVTPTGSTLLEVAGFGSSGAGNGQLKSPKGMTLDKAGNVWAADTGNNRGLQEFSHEGSYMGQFGSLSAAGNGQLSKPEGLAMDAEGNILVADGGKNPCADLLLARQLRVQIRHGRHRRCANENAGPPARFDGTNNAFVLDTGNSRLEKWTWKEVISNGGTHEPRRSTTRPAPIRNTRVAGNTPSGSGCPVNRSLPLSRKAAFRACRSLPRNTTFA